MDRAVLGRIGRLTVGMLVAVAAGNLLADALNLRWKILGSRKHLVVYHHYQAADGPVDAVFLGTSATRNAYVSRLIESELAEALDRPARVWNLGLPGGSPLPAPVVVRRLFREPRVPKVFVLEATPGYWNELRRGNNMYTYWRWFAPAGHVLGSIGEVDRSFTTTGIRGMARGLEGLWRAPTFVFPARKRNYELTRRRRGGAFGLAAIEAAERGEWVDHEEDDETRQPLGIKPLRFGDRWTETLDETARLCAERGVQFVLVNIPAREDVAGYYDEGDYEAFMEWMSEQAERLGVPFYDLNVDDWRGPTESFSAFIHLSPLGARDYGTRFSREILTPLLKAEGA